MAQLQRHPSLRFSVFELAADIGLEAHAFDGNFDAIVEEDEPQVRTMTLYSLCSWTQMLTIERIPCDHCRTLRANSDALIPQMSSQIHHTRSPRHPLTL
jgi:hypothetical protein